MESELERHLPDVEAGATLYVADEDLNVVFTNEEWRRFARGNKGESIAVPDSDAHLLENMSGKARARWTSIYGLLLDGELPSYEEDFVCSSPGERRVFRLRITPAPRADGDGTWLVHHTVRVDDRPDEAAAMRRRLRRLATDPERAARDYRARVLTRRVDVPGFRTAQYLEPLDDVGGDVLWHRRHPDGTTDVVHADAMGHGSEAAARAARLVVLLEGLAAPERAPDEVVAQLNRAMVRHTPGHETVYATGIYFRFRPGSPALACSNFGHERPLFSRTGPVELEPGLPVGMVDAGKRWHTTRLDLEEHGRRFLVFSDGITEQFGPAGAMFGTGRLLDSFRRHLAREPDAMVRAIVDDVERFRADAIVKDDRTLLALELG